jgi:NAD(P)-dependent dehydrogenase (short-subunit alcohol dehydrogenase family)
MVAETMEQWGRVDVLVNNAGILRDKSFAKMTMADFQLVVDVHLMGSVNCTKAVWDIMRDQNYGRLVMTTSSSGMYGNFGQANYGAAKMALVGFMNTLVLEGNKYGIHVNTLAPTAGTRMLEDIIEDKQVMEIMSVESVTAGLITLCDKDAPNRTILCAGAGGYATTHIYETEGIFLPSAQQTPENVRANIDAINDPNGERILTAGSEQTNKFVQKAITYIKSL